MASVAACELVPEAIIVSAPTLAKLDVWSCDQLSGDLLAELIESAHDCVARMLSADGAHSSTAACDQSAESYGIDRARSRVSAADRRPGRREPRRCEPS